MSLTRAPVCTDCTMETLSRIELTREVIDDPDIIKCVKCKSTFDKRIVTISKCSACGGELKPLRRWKWKCPRCGKSVDETSKKS